MADLTQRVNITTVAAEAGVGVGTVSRVLNGSPQVREATRRRVLDVIGRLDYRPNRVAAALSRGTTSSVSVMVTDLTRPSVVERLAGVLAVLDQHGYDTVVLNVEAPEQRDRYLTALATQRRADGVIMVSLPLGKAHTDVLGAAGIPLVMVDATATGIVRYMIDNVAGGRLATEHLLGLGHRRVAFLGEATVRSFSFASTELRLRGYKLARRDAGEPAESDVIRLVPGRGAEVSVMEAANELIDLGPRPTAIFAASDVHAMGVLHAVEQRGLRVPEDISLVGFDDVESAALVGLTTVRQPLYESGAQAAKRLCQLMSGEPGSGRNVVLPVELVDRHSTGPPGGAGAGSGTSVPEARAAGPPRANRDGLHPTRTRRSGSATALPEPV
ncbi:MAG TPA: LacI family DNA-binding transcriptional regulator [Acidimicrobiales bacterium]|nr:LacI family DNA-binding transcriptional regulator [Acidimicrobiales bacterium]